MVFSSNYRNLVRSNYGLPIFKDMIAKVLRGWTTKEYHAEWKRVYHTGPPPRQLCCEAADVVPVWRRKHSSSNGLKKRRSETNMAAL